MSISELARDYIHHLGIGHVIGGIISPVHDAYGKDGLVESKHRLAMVKLGIQSSAWIHVSDWECEQDGWTRTRHVLAYHQKCLNEDALNGNANGCGWLPDNVTGPVKLRLLCGADLLESFAKPGLWKEEDLEAILSENGLIVVGRSGCNPEKFIFESDQLTQHRVGGKFWSKN